MLFLFKLMNNFFLKNIFSWIIFFLAKYNENVKKLTTALHENVQLQRQIDEYSQDLNEKSSELTNCQLSIATLKVIIQISIDILI